MSKQEYEKIRNNIIKKVGDRYQIDYDEAMKLHSDNPDDYDIVENERELKGLSVKINNKRFDKFPDRLPADKLPHPVDEHSLMGMYETKRDLYLTIAHAFNKAMERIENLEKQVYKLTRQG